ncbi:putative transcriptional regulator [Acetoanaerobium noterae]|uniref:Putative transcriptional regulator n=1 Tax=Acetoanaerobium noterae TaxID=745369 RepID=A0A1T5A0W0_9FIRM|nr:helix-turn-helix domain-containing protein [Acetoanaerobium noterae]SKB28588.1 putative transcriptional regulator [Acetoanaerobium noterae]
MPVQSKLKGLIAEFGLSQKQLAKHLGITLRTFNDKINGKTDFSLKEARIVSSYFGKTIEEIFLESELTQTKQN